MSEELINQFLEAGWEQEGSNSQSLVFTRKPKSAYGDKAMGYRRQPPPPPPVFQVKDQSMGLMPGPRPVPRPKAKSSRFKPEPPKDPGLYSLAPSMFSNGSYNYHDREALKIVSDNWKRICSYSGNSKDDFGYSGGLRSTGILQYGKDLNTVTMTTYGLAKVIYDKELAEWEGSQLKEQSEERFQTGWKEASKSHQNQLNIYIVENNQLKEELNKKKALECVHGDEIICNYEYWKRIKAQLETYKRSTLLLVICSVPVIVTTLMMIFL